MSFATKGDPPKTMEDVMRIVKAEYDYWNNMECGNDPVKGAMSIAAVGACSNIIAAIHGMRAEWHPQPERKDGASSHT